MTEEKQEFEEDNRSLVELGQRAFFLAILIPPLGVCLATRYLYLTRRLSASLPGAWLVYVSWWLSLLLSLAWVLYAMTL